MKSTNSKVLLWLYLFCLGTAFALPQETAAASTTKTAVRGSRRSLKKEDSKGDDKSPASDISIVESAYGDDPDEWVGFMPEGMEDEDSERTEDDEDDKDKEEKEDAESATVLLQEQYPAPEETITFVTLPTIHLQLGVDVAPMSREDRQSSGRDNSAAVEALMEEYFEGQLNVRDDFMMGPNYVSSEVEAIMSQQQENVLDFTINGEAQYLGLPTPSQEDVKNTLTQYFGLPTFWEKTDLESYLEENGIMGAEVNVMYVKNYPVAGDASNFPTDSSSENRNPLTENDSSNANVNNNESDKKPVGLILGFILFFLCLFAAIIMLLTTYKKDWIEKMVDRASACWACCKDRTKKTAAMSPLAERQRKNRRGWRDFDEEGSKTAAGADRNVSEYGDSTTARSGSGKELKQQKPQVMQWLSSKLQDLSMSFCKDESDEPSQVLQNIQVVVDNDQLLKQQQQTLQRGEDGGPVYRNFSTADASRYQYSAKTEPRSNVYGGMTWKAAQEDTSPQKTLGTYASDDDDALSVEDPILTYASSSRGAAASPTPYRSSRETEAPASHPWKQDTKTSPSAGGAAEEGTLTTSLTEWTNYLNPCLAVPSLPLFQYESERLDDLVASIPRNKSLADDDDDEEEDDDDDSYTDTEGGTTNTRTRTPSPPRRSRSGINRNSRIGRSNSSHHVRSSSGGNYHASRSRSSGNLPRSASSNQVGRSSNSRSQHRRGGSSQRRSDSNGRRFQPPQQQRQQQQQQQPQQRDQYRRPKESRYHYSNREI